MRNSKWRADSSKPQNNFNNESSQELIINKPVNIANPKKEAGFPIKPMLNKSVERLDIPSL